MGDRRIHRHRRRRQAVFVLYMVFTFVVATIAGGSPPYQAAFEALLLPIALIAVVGGSLSALFCVIIPWQ